MAQKRLHSLKSTEKRSYEILFSILDSVDAINELNDKLDKGEMHIIEVFKEVSVHMDIMESELKTLKRFWKWKTDKELGKQT